MDFQNLPDVLIKNISLYLLPSEVKNLITTIEMIVMKDTMKILLLKLKL